MGSDLRYGMLEQMYEGFQSTLPGWGATWMSARRTCTGINFNPRSPDGERQGAQDGANWIDAFQSTLPGWGATVISMFFGIIITIFQSTLPGWGATCYAVACNRSIEFQSTLPGWGATKRGRETRGVIEISIHAPRMGSDTTTGRRTSLPSYFNPRSPDGERQVAVVGGVAAGGFQSTLPGWGATQQ